MYHYWNSINVSANAITTNKQMIPLDQGCSLGLERLVLETVSRRFFERLGLVSVSASYVSFT